MTYRHVETLVGWTALVGARIEEFGFWYRITLIAYRNGRSHRAASSHYALTKSKAYATAERILGKR